MTPKTIRQIFKTLRDLNPAPTTELAWNSDFELLIAVILSAQATDKSVNKATATLFKVANTPEKIVALGLTKLKQHIKTIGLYSTKAKNVMATCQILIDRFDSQVPQTREELESLPGVGRKTANVILNTCFKQPVIAVDTHIFRVANRIGLAHGTTPRAVEDQLMQNIPKEFKLDAHHWLILLGRYTCIARQPRCPSCPVRKWCEYPDKTT
jgi:endonuclease-3